MGRTLTALLMTVLAGTAAATMARQVAQAPQEGITVHGHWAIDVKQPDGTLVIHREFENALQASGGLAMADLLARRSTAGTWVVSLNANNSPADGPCLFNNSIGASCQLVEPGQPALPGTYFTNLSIGATGFVLTGTATAGRVGRIDAVGTALHACPSTLLASACAAPTPGANFTSFSRTVLFPSIFVVAGQLIQVTVTFTFS